ncbi:molybdate ABC transporter permease subunit [Peptoniphilus catoniae]|uniref:molybdate ABC transporter permease subunit n=1 Tax=Peptoniphilus catoniae TaxID=1660341 RepID=UPI0010FECC97|nr:molybdate ABC transporter permease subunit [Peptoniphilus catoniae]
MDLYPLYNSLRISIISTILIFFIGVLSAYYISKSPKFLKAILDVVLTLPLVLPPTVIGFFILKLLSPNSTIGSFIMNVFQEKIIMKWYSAIISTTIVSFPLMYRTARGAFESYDKKLTYAAKTLGVSNARIFWTIMLPTCKEGIIAGTILSFARALGEYGATSMVAGYTPGKTATISTTVYQLWRIGKDAEAYKWVLINVFISFVVLFAINYFEKNQQKD